MSGPATRQRVGEPVFTIYNLTSPTTNGDSFVTVKHPFTSNPNAKNIDPRIGLAWDPFGDHKTSIRAGFGMFHEPVTARTYPPTTLRFTRMTRCSFFSLTRFPNLPSSPHQLIGGDPGRTVDRLVLCRSAQCRPGAVHYAVQPDRAARAGGWDSVDGGLQRFLGQKPVPVV